MNLTQSLIEVKSISSDNPAKQTVKLTKACYYHSFDILFNGSVITTFSGSPVLKPTGILDNICTEISVKVNNDVVKSVRPWMVSRFNFLCSGKKPTARSSAAAAAVAPIDNITAESYGAIGTTGQCTSFISGLRIPFTHPLALDGDATALRTMPINGDISSAELNFIFQSWQNIEGTSTPIVIAYTSYNYSISVIGVEYADYPANSKPHTFYQTSRIEQISAQVTQKKFDIQTGYRLLGIAILCESNLTPTGSVEVAKKLSNIGIKNIGLVVNGKTYPLDATATFIQKQSEMLDSKRVDARYVSNAMEFEGYLYLDFMAGKSIYSGLDLRNAATCQLIITTNAAVAATPYLTYPLAITIEEHHLRESAV
jgi:hypothetical protein